MEIACQTSTDSISEIADDVEVTVTTALQVSLALINAFNPPPVVYSCWSYGRYQPPCKVVRVTKSYDKHVISPSRFIGTSKQRTFYALNARQ